MRLVCPVCGAVASLEALTNDPAARQVLEIMSRLPQPIASRVPAYLGLFRRGSRGLSWSRALRLITDLQTLVSTGRVHWPGGEERPAPPQLWAGVMDRMIARRFDDDPLEDHNYLRRAVWGEAAQLAAQAERQNYVRKPPEPGPEGPAEREPERVRRSCFTCASFVPPKKCSAGSRPTSGNELLGCGTWTAKPAQVGELMSGILSNLHEK